ncbi:MAG: amidinotransferase [Gammaproteobacteria bacterium]|nr:amidinotransferase [Gammaproteobacteria bacterium]
MHKTGIEFDFDLAQRQHREMVQIYQDAGVTCHFLESDRVLHRSFFVRDSIVMTSWGALICHMQLKCRRADYHTVIKFYQENNIPIWRYATAGHFEGGDFVILESGTALIGYCGERSEQEGSEQVADFVHAEGWDVEVVPIPTLFVHMDGLVVPLDYKLVVTCLDVLESWVINWLKKKGFNFVDVEFSEAKDLGVNLLSLGNKKVLSMAGSVKLNKDSIARGYEVFAPDMSMFTLGGGGVHCLCQALKRDSV